MVGVGRIANGRRLGLLGSRIVCFQHIAGPPSYRYFRASKRSPIKRGRQVPLAAPSRDFGRLLCSREDTGRRTGRGREDSERWRGH